jgi:hypothetical protein
MALSRPEDNRNWALATVAKDQGLKRLCDNSEFRVLRGFAARFAETALPFRAARLTLILRARLRLATYETDDLQRYALSFDHERGSRPFAGIR